MVDGNESISTLTESKDSGKDSRRLSQMPNVAKVGQLFLENVATDVDVQKCLNDNAENLPSYLRVSLTEITIYEPICPYKRNRERDLKHEVCWACVRKKTSTQFVLRHQGVRVCCR